MKTKNILKIAAAFLFVGMFTACVQDDDYSTPEINQIDPNLTVTNTIADVYTMQSVAGGVYEFDDEGTNLILEGYVVSSDRTGNFYKEIYIQNSAENPTHGLKISVDAYDLYLKYGIGRKVYVKLNGLAVDDENGVMTIGVANGTSLNRISELTYENHIISSTELTTIVPRETTPSTLGALNNGILVQLNDMQLPLGSVGQHYGEPGSTFTQNRIFETCESGGGTIILRNSGYSDFKSYLMPQGRGTMVAVLSQYNSDRQLFISDPSNLDMEGQRCDPLFGEAFSAAVDGTTLDISGWINYAESGSELWTEQVYSGNGYAEFSAFGTGDTSNIGWLISPGIDFDAQSGEILTFETEHAYPDAGHDAIEVFISTDFDGTESGIATATWTSLNFTSSLEADFGSWYTWTNSGDIDLSSYTGTGYIAFKYTGSDTSNMNTTIHVDNVVVRVP